ncbi:MAG: ABC transporter ATP-binding protein [Oscillospiraceae bacterium]|nr:ABC transporter ATP-binding protein [Oscillospiraceae bacterium]
MIKVIKHLKSSVVPILFVVVLLFVQAYCDLALPQYMSNIVNIGIQQGGISSVIPEKITEKDMSDLQLFMSEDMVKTVNENYVSNNGILTLKENIDSETNEKLENAFIDPELISVMIDMVKSGKMDASNNAYQSGSELSGLFSKFPEDSNIYDVMRALPEQQRIEAVNKMTEALEGYKSLGKDSVKQLVVSYVKVLLGNAGVDTDSLQMMYLVKAGLLMLLYAFIIAVCTILTTLLGARIGAGFARDLRSSVYKKVLQFSNKEINKFSNASLITRCTNDIQQIQMVIIMLLRMVLYAPIIGIGALLKVLGTNQSMAWIIAIAIVLITLLMIFLMVVAMPKFTKLQKLIDRINLVSREILTGLPVIRAFSREKHEEERFDVANKNQMKTNLFVNRIMAMMMPVMMLIMNGISVLIIWVGASNVDAGNMQVGDIMAYIQYTMQIIMAFLMIAMMSIMLPRAIVSVNRVAEILNTEVSITNPKESEIQSFDDGKKGVVEFKNVSFKYPGASENVLSDITFTANPGETTAIIGSTGSGKSTLINLIPRFYDVTQGELKVDGADVNKVTINSLRDKIGYVPQKGFLFSGTIESNIAYSDESMSREQVEKAAEIAQAKDFIEEKYQNYDNEIAQGGTNVSGGQRQRLSIARAVAKNPEIYIFDDSFSALDYKTDVALRKALKQYTENSTVIIVAQRISTVLNAEQIIVLDDGKIAGKGTHKELMESCEVYRQIAVSQLSKEELE